MSATRPRGHSLSVPLASLLPAGSSRLVGVPLVVRPPRCRLPSASPSRSSSASASPSRSSSSRSSFPLARETRFFTGRQREQGEGGLGLVAICAVVTFVAPEGAQGGWETRRIQSRGGLRRRLTLRSPSNRDEVPRAGPLMHSAYTKARTCPARRDASHRASPLAKQLASSDSASLHRASPLASAARIERLSSSPDGSAK